MGRGAVGRVKEAEEGLDRVWYESGRKIRTR